LAAVLVVVGLQWLVGVAHADIYTVYGCSLPEGGPAPTDGWTAESNHPAASLWWNTCQDFTARERSMNADLRNAETTPNGADWAQGGDHADWTFHAPSDTVLAGYTIYRHESSGGDWLDWRGVGWFDDLSGGTEIGGCSVINGCQEHGSTLPDQPLSGGNQVVRDGTALHWLRISAECSTLPQPDSCDTRDDVANDYTLIRDVGSVSIYATRMRLRDLVGPMFIDRPSGSLLDTTAPIDGIRLARVTAQDGGGGLAGAEVLADGHAIASAVPDTYVSTCAVPYVAVVPCPLRSTFTLQADTTVLTNGFHQLRVAVTDAGGNEVLSDPVIVTVQNDGRPNGSDSTRLATLSARFRGATHDAPLRVAVHFGSPARLGGKLTDASGRPIAAARLNVAFRVHRPGAPWKVANAVTTDSKGDWSVPIQPGPSRDVKVSYQAFEFDAAPAAQVVGTVSVRARVRLTVKPSRVSRHGRIRFLGQLVGGPGRQGTQVALYAVTRTGGGRVPVAVLRADEHGRFAYAYRFSRTLGPVTYWFQANVAAQTGYPYTPWRSRRVWVHVR
jgi:hypothetical protein